MRRTAISEFKFATTEQAKDTNRSLFWVAPLMIILLTSLVSLTPASAQTDDKKIVWNTGRELEKQLELAVSAELTGSKIRESLYQFGNRKAIGVFVDRRVDSNLKLELSLVDLTVEQLILQVAEAHDFGMCRIGDLFYVGPKNAANELDMLVEQHAQSVSKDGAFKDVIDWRKKGNLSWNELAKPRQILLELAEQNNFKIVNPEAIPHDLWPAVQMPRATLGERVAILLAGFDMWFKSSGKGHIKIVDWPKLETGTRTIRNVKDARNVARRLREAYSDSKFVDKGRSLKITGPVEQVGIVVREVMDLRVADGGDPALQRFTLSTTAKRSSILRTLARQMKLELSINSVLKKIMDERVTIQANQQPADVIIKQILDGTGARHRIMNERLLISR